MFFLIKQYLRNSNVTFKAIKNAFFLFTVILSFLKRERERFPLFVPKLYYVTTRKFQGVPDRSKSLTVHRS